MDPAVPVDQVVPVVALVKGDPQVPGLGGDLRRRAAQEAGEEKVGRERA